MKKPIKIPLIVLPTIADIIVSNDLVHEIIAASEADETITLEITYNREERQCIHDIEDYVEDMIESMSTEKPNN